MSAFFILPETEEALLGTIIANPEASMPWACSALSLEDFGIPTNGQLWRTLATMEASQKPISFANICTELRDLGLADAITPARISTLHISGTSPGTLPAMLDQLREKRALRLLFAGLTELLPAISAPGADAASLIERAQLCIESAGKTRVRAISAPKMPELVREAVDRIQARQLKQPDETGIPTGLTVLDRETGGMRIGATWVIAGPHKGGKSMLALNLLSAAADVGKRSLFFGLEMPAVENVERLISSGGILAEHLRDGTMSEADFTKLSGIAQRLNKAPIQFREDVFDIGEMMAVAKQYKLAYPDLFAVFVDYAQLVGADAIRGGNREQEVAQVSTALRRLAMQEKLCVVVLSQLNDDGKLRESRRLGMDATVIATIQDEEDEPKVKRVKLVQRNGRQCTIRLAYRGEFMRFDSLPDGESYPKAEDPDQKTQTKKQYRSRTND